MRAGSLAKAQRIRAKISAPYFFCINEFEVPCPDKIYYYVTTKSICAKIVAIKIIRVEIVTTKNICVKKGVGKMMLPNPIAAAA